MAKYQIKANYYADGVLYTPGDVITVPDNVKPSVTWKLIEEGKPEPAKVEAPKADKPALSEFGRAKRASDREPI